jgi:hypothetical protein
MGIIDTFKDVATLVNKAGSMELYQKIVELQTQVMGVLEENHALRNQLREASERLRFQMLLEFRGNMYWARDGDGNESGPYCSKCWDADTKAIRLQRIENGVQWCPRCEKSAPAVPGQHNVFRL